jgi:hypothetical protein
VEDKVESVLGFLGFVLRQLAFEAIFFWPGWAVLKVLTLGRYPRLRGQYLNLDYTEITLIVFVGVLSVFGLVVLAAKFWPEMVQVSST